MKKKYYLIVLPVLIVLFFNACKSRQKVEIVINQNVNQTKLTGEDVQINQANFKWFDGKFNAEINNNGKINTVKGRVRMRQDSLIWISIKPDVAIIEVFRILIDKDSLRFINYLDKEYVLEEFSAISQIAQYDINFSMLQGIFTGNPYFMFAKKDYQVNVSEKDTVLSSSDMKLYLGARNQQSGAEFLFQALFINLQKKAWRNILYDPKSRLEMEIQYPEYQLIDSVLFPLNGRLSIVGDTVNTRFGFDYTKTIVNEPFDFPFTIPKSFKRISLQKK